MHPHLERRHRRACEPRDLLVRPSLDMLQHEHLSLLGRQIHQRPFQRPPALAALEGSVRAIERREGHIHRLAPESLTSPPPPPPSAPAAPYDAQPYGRPVPVNAVRPTIESRH